MIPTGKIVELISAFKVGDQYKIDLAIKDIIAVAEKKGQIKLAQQLRKLYSAPSLNRDYDENRKLYPQGFSNPNTTKLFERRVSKVGVSDIILSQKNKDIFDEIRASFLERKQFIKEGIASENKILIYGEPGTGKTLFAYVIAGALDLPILHVHLDSLVSSYLGDTGKNIRQIFEEARKESCVLFIDEFDSIAKKRDDHYELGELKRVVTVLLQNIDDFPPDSILVAATNHHHLLDEAIWRRFDYQLNLDILDKKALEALLELYLGKSKNIEIELLAFVAQGKSGAVIKQAIHKALRKKILKKSTEDINVFLLEELLKIANLKVIDFKAEENKKRIKNIVQKLKAFDSKYYTFKRIEEITGIPDSTLSLYSK